ncbi:hypothetical protein [Plantactinospora sp. WMMB782]|uniref:hypothetical protein n=1 Tax=Plantactinospora sp. WMMB782 TaxID=3404121 RepID=UPI003B94B04B
MGRSRPFRRTGRRRLLWAAGVVVALLVAVSAGLSWAFPSVAAAFCPSCYGLEQLRPGLYVERGVPAEQRSRAAEVADEAARRVAAFYGGERSSARLLVCYTDACYRRIGGGGERGRAVLDRVVLLSPRGVDVVIAAHERSHVELYHRLRSPDAVPQWFQEGLAVLVSDDLRYLLPATAADRCRVVSGEPLPQTLDDWLAARGGDRLYAVAACRVSRWVAGHGGPAAVLDLIDRVNRGERFSTLVPG